MAGLVQCPKLRNQTCGSTSSLAERIADAGAIAHQAARQGELMVWVDRGQRMARRQRRQLVLRGQSGSRAQARR